MKTWPEKPRILRSYAYITGDEWPVKCDADVVIDSGAFTAFTTGRTINLREYGEFLVRHAAKITFAFNLDVIRDHVGSARNYDRLQAIVGDRVKIVPTWHNGSPWEEFERLCREHDYISIGGAVGISTKQLMQYSVKAHRIAREHGTRLHGLGITRNDLMLRLPWASVDSSSWLYPARYPMVILPDRDGHMIYGKTGAAPTPELARVLRAYGVPVRLVRPTFQELKTRDPAEAKARSLTLRTASARGYMYAESVRRKKNPEFSLYLATGGGDEVPIDEAWRAGPPWL